MGALYSIGLVEANAGMPDAVRRVREHEREPGHRVNAQRVQLLSALMQGEFAEAAAAQRRAELVMLQDGALVRYPNTTARMELHACAFAEDLPALKQVLDRVERAALQWPHWRPVAQLALCHCRRLQGDVADALECIEQSIAGVQPLQHRDWAMIAAAHVQMLVASARTAEAVARGQQYLAICERERLHGERSVAHHLAEALLASGEVGPACALVERSIAQIIGSGARGLVLGAAYELRARVAIVQRDPEAFARFAELCALENKVDRNPNLAGRYERMVREAADVGIAGHAPGLVPRAADAAPLVQTDLASSIHSRLFDRTDPDSRAACLLTVLSEHADFEQAFLFGVRAGRVVLLASLPDQQAPEALACEVERYLARQVEALDATQFTEARADSGSTARQAPAFELAEALLQDGPTAAVPAGAADPPRGPVGRGGNRRAAFPRRAPAHSAVRGARGDRLRVARSRRRRRRHLPRLSRARS